MSLVLGRLARHTDNRGDALTYWAAAEQLAADVGDQSLRATALVDCTHYSDRADALRLLEEAETHLDPSSSEYLRAWLFTRRARVLAALGIASGAYRALERASTALGNARTQPSGYFSGWNSHWLASYEADCAIHLGRFQHAADLLEALLANSHPAPYHELALLSDLAVAYAHQHEVQRSCDSLSRAIGLGAKFQLSEQLRHVDRICRRYLSTWQGHPAVRQLEETLSAAVKESLAP